MVATKRVIKVIVNGFELIAVATIPILFMMFLSLGISIQKTRTEPNDPLMAQFAKHIQRATTEIENGTHVSTSD